MTLSTEKLLTLTQFQTGLTAAKNYTDTKTSEVNSKVTTLIGSDSGKSVRTISNEEIAAQLIPENASESLDTLQEISAWIQEHPEDAATMNLDISTIKSQLTGFGTTSGSVKAYVDQKSQEAGIKLTSLSMSVTGSGNAVTNGSYDNTSGIFTLTKGETFLTEEDITLATNEEVTAVCESVFGV